MNIDTLNAEISTLESEHRTVTGDLEKARRVYQDAITARSIGDATPEDVKRAKAALDKAVEACQRAESLPLEIQAKRRAVQILSGRSEAEELERDKVTATAIWSEGQQVRADLLATLKAAATLFERGHELNRRIFPYVADTGDQQNSGRPPRAAVIRTALGITDVRYKWHAVAIERDHINVGYDDFEGQLKRVVAILEGGPR